MAIFEHETAKKVLIDDTETLSCVIENWQNVNGHTEYIIKVQRGPTVDKCWRVHKRYNDFVQLHSQLQAACLPIVLPPKRLIGNLDPEFIAERQQGLQKYLNFILMNPILASSLPAKSFVDPANYCQPFSEIALQHVSLALRGEVGWEVVGPLTDIGWRLRKHYYQVKCKAAPKEELMASWTDFGPDKHLEDKDLHAIFKSLLQLKHPYIHPVKLCLCTDVGALIVRENHKEGSLRDTLCQAKPRQSFMKKYGNPKGHKALDIGQVALYGRQILEALKFLHDKGLPYGHLHVGNVIIVDGKARLLDIENGVLGVASFYRPYFMQHRRIAALEAIDVYCFGHTIYEMAFGVPLQESNLENRPPDCPANLGSLLESILSAEAFKNGMPTLDALIKHNFFAGVHLATYNDDKIHFKIPTSTKEEIKRTQLAIEERLRDEQKMMRSQKRLVRVQELMSSEEEKRKQRSKKKHEMKQQSRDREKRNSQDEPPRERNGTNGDRTDSTNSASTATSIGTATPPSASGSSRVPSPPQAPPPPPPHPPNPTADSPGENKRTALLGAITNFDKSVLRKAKTSD